MHYTERALQNVMSFQFYADVWIGSPKQKLTMMFDTGSSQAWAYSKRGCNQGAVSTCPPIYEDMFDHIKSNTFEAGDDEAVYLRYALGAIQGYQVHDKFCFDSKIEDLCVDKLTFILVDSAQQMENYKSSGFIGLSPIGN
jgi:hypothetical protein